MTDKKRRQKYTPDMAGRLYRYFIGYDDRGLPSIPKFARSVGLTVADVEDFRRHKRFEEAYRECMEIRRDYLIDQALERRFDPSLTKFLLQEDDVEVEDKEMRLVLEVKE